MNRVKEQFKKTASVNGSYSVGLIILVLCVAVMINVVAAKLPEGVRNIDISDNKIYEITDTSRKLLKNLEQKVTMTVYAEKSSTDERIVTFLNKYEALSKNLTLEWVDPVLHPAELTENNVTENSILVSCEETGKSETISFDDILVVDTYSYYMTGNAEASEFDGEGQLTSAVNYVTSGVQSKIYYTSGHGEQTFSTSVQELLQKNNISQNELNLLMEQEIPEDCDLVVMNGVAADISEEEKEILENYMAVGGDVMILLGDLEGDAPNLDTLLNEYGMQRVNGYIADMERCYQGSYYYIFPVLAGDEALMDGMSTGMVMLANAHGMEMIDPARDTIATTSFMTTSSNGYAVTEDEQLQGTYVLGAVATETIEGEEAVEKAEKDAEEGDAETEVGSVESRLTVISSASLLDSQITDAFATLENLTLFGNAAMANFDGVQNIAIESKSLAITYNAMQHVGLIGFLCIIGIPVIILIYGFRQWLKRRKA
ncbi:MAG: GldG family protein [Eubacteriales bacterium]|nr:GldG family protein [Eubacteriales bacterium]